METLWRELKFYFELKVKPHNKQEHGNCIKKFWKRKITPEKRAKYIDHVWQRLFQLRWRFEVLKQNITNGSVRSHRGLLHLIFC